MNVQVSLSEWKFKEVDGVRKIVGSYKLKVGGQEIANQDFNDGYGNSTIIFPTILMVEVEALNDKIEKAIIENFTGKKKEE